MRQLGQLLLWASVPVAVVSELILHYPLTDEINSPTASDISGNGNDGTIVGDPEFMGVLGLKLDGVDDYVKLPDNIMTGLTSMTISLQAFVRSEQDGNYFIFGLGKSTNGIGDGYVFATGNPYRAAISPGNWASEAESRTDKNLPRDTWKTLTYVINGTTTTALYLDGELVAGHTNNQPIVSPSSLGSTTENYIGRSQYVVDNYFAGSVRDFQIYDHALSATEVAALVPSDAERINIALAGLVITNIDDVRGNIHLPTTKDGMSVSWSTSNTNVISIDGIVHRQSSQVQVIITATITSNGVSGERSMTATVKAAAKMESFEGYLFSYFTGNSISGENIFFAASDGNNALKWTELNDGQAYLTSSKGTKGLRDPFIIRSPEGDTFYLIATDLSIGSGTSWGEAVTWGSHYLEVWESHDLINWGEQRHCLVSPENAGNTWAPEAYYDEDLGSYVVFWASSLYDNASHTGSTYHRMIYVTTRDFVTFSDPVIWQDAGMSRIDSTVLKADDAYHRFTKDEGASGTGCSDIIQERSDQLLSQIDSWTIVATCIGANAGTMAVEGPTVFRSNEGDVNGDKFYLFIDEYGGRGYIPLETTNISAGDWVISSSYQLPSSPRHGTVIPITAAELSLVTTTLAKRADVSKGEIVRYDFTSVTGRTIRDISGNGHSGTIYGEAAVSAGVITFDGSDDYVVLPNNLLADVEDMTIECEVFIDSTQKSPYFIYGIGNTVDDLGNGYIFTTGNAYRTSISLRNYQAEETVTSGANLERDTWIHLTYTLSGSTATLYLNGIQVSQSISVTNNPSDIGLTSANYLGRSMYTNDSLLTGKMRKFAIFNRALSPSEVFSLSGNTGAIYGTSLSDASSLKIDPIVDTNKNRVLFPVYPGTDLTALAPVFSVAESVTVTPVSGTVADLSKNITYTLLSSDGTTNSWTMSAVEMKSPVIMGLYADPNIIIFDNTAYIYATTDGYIGWGGNAFYVWSSRNLVDWERSKEPILILDGSEGNVPWAAGNAWAPTIARRNKKYYFYFSGHNIEYGWKTIGVAAADSPMGPFTAEEEAMILNKEAITSGQAIDPAIFEDPETGKWYIFWGNGSPVYAEMEDNMISIKESTLAFISGLADFREGLFLNYRQGIYHLTYAIEDTGSEDYRVGYATSSSIHGPWTYRGVILKKDTSRGILATGHSSIVQVPGTDEWYIAYHRFHIPGGDGTHRETTIDKLNFDEDGLIQEVTPTLESVDARPLVDVNKKRYERIFRVRGQSQAMP